MAFGSSSAGATLVVKVVTDATDAARGLDTAAGSMGRFGTGVQRAAVPLGIATAGLVAFGTEAFAAASAAEQSAGAVDAVFKGSSSAVHDFARDAADAMGLSAAEYEQMAATFGAQLKNMGTAADDLAPATDDLIGLGADLAAQFGGSTSDAVGALSSLLRGETDPIERYGVSIKAADVAAKKAAMGLDGLTGEADKQATAQATLALLTEQTADATGAFARESDTAAGQQARATAAFKDTKAALGTALLPIVAKASEMFAKVAAVIGKHPRLFQILAVAIGAVTAAVWLMNAAMAANPITLIVIAVAALIAGLVLLWDNCEAFRKIVLTIRDVAVKAFKAILKAVDWVWGWIKKLFGWIKSNWPKLLAILTGPIGIAVLLIVRYWRQIIAVIQLVIRWIKGAFVSAWQWLKSVVVSVITTVRRWLELAIASIRRVITWVRDSLSAAWRTMRDVVVGVVERVRGLIQSAIDKLSALWDWIARNIPQAFGYLWSAASWVMGLVRDAVSWPINALNALWGWLAHNIPQAFGMLWNAASWVFGLIRDAVQWPIDKVRELIGWIGNIHWPSPPSWLKSGWDFITPWSAVPPPTFASPARYNVVTPAGVRRSMRRSSASSSPAGTVINISGALDPDRVARQVERVLVSRARRVGGVRING